MDNLISQLKGSNIPYTLNGQHLTIHGDMKITRFSFGHLNDFVKSDTFPENLTVEGDLHVGQGIQSLPASLKVGKDLNLSYSGVESLPDNFTIPGILRASNSHLRALPENLTVKSLYIGGTAVKMLPESLKVTDTLNIVGTDIAVLPANLHVNSLYLENTKIAALPDGLTLAGDLNVSNMPELARLPENLTVGDCLLVGKGKITEIPASSRIETLYIYDPENFSNVVSERFSDKHMNHCFAVRTRDGIKVSEGQFFGDITQMPEKMQSAYSAEQRNLYLEAMQRCADKLELETA